MKLIEADSILLQYNRLRAKAKEAALAKIKEADKKANKGKESSFIRYLELQDFYVDEGLDNLVVTFGFGDNAPYSGTEEVNLKASDIKNF